MMWCQVGFALAQTPESYDGSQGIRRTFINETYAIESSIFDGKRGDHD